MSLNERERRTVALVVEHTYPAFLELEAHIEERVAEELQIDKEAWSTQWEGPVTMTAFLFALKYLCEVWTVGTPDDLKEVSREAVDQMGRFLAEKDPVALKALLGIGDHSA